MSPCTQALAELTREAANPAAPVAMRRQLIGAALVLTATGSGALLPTAVVQAASGDPVQLEGQTLPRAQQLAGTTVQLNGAGVRGVAWFKAFVAALWVAQPSRDAEVLLTQTGPKRLSLRMLYDLPGLEFAKAFRKGVLRNAPNEAAAQVLEARMARFEQTVTALGTLRKGETVDLDFDPNRGTSLSRNGKLVGDPWDGADFYAGLLRAFIGQQPYDEKLKAGLLGLKA